MYAEQVLLPEGFRIEVAFLDRERWKLSLKKHDRLVVEYSSAKPYDFKSVEKLRYDFERDVERALRQG